MPKLLLLLVILTITGELNAQKIIANYTPQSGTLTIGENKNDTLPYTDKGYTLILPEKTASIKGVLISLDDQPFNLKRTTPQRLIHPAANAKGLAVLYVSTGIPVDLYFNTSSLSYVDSLLKQVFISHQLPNKNIFFFGTMVSGHRALKYIEYCKKGESQFQPSITGAVLSESAIDWVRMWYEGQKQVRDKFNDVQLFEGKLISYLFKKHLQETPKENLEKYLDFSPYSYFDTELRHIPYFKDIAVRAYTFAPINYWFTANGKGVNDCNYPDMSGLINELKLAGNTNAELIVFSNDKREKVSTMEVQSNTWNLVDKNELIDWVLLHSN